MGKNAGWLLADKLIRMPISLGVGIWIARYLGPDRLGQLSYATAFAALFSAVASLGLDAIAVRELLHRPDEKDEVLGSVFFLKLLAGCATFAVTVAATLVVGHVDAQTRLLVEIIAAGTIFQSFDVIDYWFQSRVESKNTVLAQNPTFLALSIVKVVLVVTKAPLTAFAWVATAEVAASALSLVLVFHLKHQTMRRWVFRWATARRLLADSWPLIFSLMVGMIYLRIDQVMLGQMVGTEEVGIYSIAVRLAEIWYIVPHALYSSTLPSILEAIKISDELFYERLQKLFNLMVFIGYAVAIPVTFLSGWVVTFLFGRSYAAAGPMLAILIWGGVATNLGIARSAYLTARNWQTLHFVAAVFGAVSNVVLNLWLIPRYGGIGAAIASCIAYWIAGHGSSFVFRRLRKTAFMMTRALVYPRIW
jgi:O-antigen/teichoic acid export membrane protein